MSLPQTGGLLDMTSTEKEHSRKDSGLCSGHIVKPVETIYWWREPFEISIYIHYP